MLNRSAHFMRCLLASAALIALPCAHAERADRDKPVNIEADKLMVDDRNKVQIFEGRVKLTQGTLQILADRVVVSQDADGFEKAVATSGTGGLARFRQKREGKSEYIDGEAEQIDYSVQTEKALLQRRAWVRSGLDEVRGPYIEYDGLTENYVVTNGSNARVVEGGQRVQAVIQPKKRESAAPAPTAPAGEFAPDQTR